MYVCMYVCMYVYIVFALKLLFFTGHYYAGVSYKNY